MATALAFFSLVLVSRPALAVTPVLTTQASSPGSLVGSAIFDAGNLSGGVNPTGSITFDLFGPDNSTCTGVPIFTSVVAVAGNGGYTSKSHIALSAGTYRWVVRYSGDANNEPVASACDDPGQRTVVDRAPTSITTAASPSVRLGGQVYDVATLRGGVNPSGFITFDLVAGGCGGDPVFFSSKPVVGNGPVTSDAFTPIAPGEYTWLARYGGDANNGPASSLCFDSAEKVTVTQGQGVVVLTLAASPPLPVGGPLTATATVSGGTNPRGRVTFQLFAPDDPTCSGAPLFNNVPRVLDGTPITSDPFTTTAPGTYRWVALYSGDANHAPVRTACGDPAGTVTVLPAADVVVLTTAASSPFPAGTPLMATATISSGANPTGTITFRLFGPPGDCFATPLLTAVKSVSGNGTYTSDPFVPRFPGRYTWVVSYSGDANHLPVETACGDPSATVIVPLGPRVVVLTTTASAPGAGPLTDTAALSGGVNPTGGISFRLFGPDDTTCSGGPVHTSFKLVVGNGSYTSEPFMPRGPGTYRWVATYGGDVNHAAASTVCNDPAETVVVTGVPGISVTKHANPSSRPAPGGDFTFTVTVTNTLGALLNLQTVTDDVYGDLSTPPGSPCAAARGHELRAGESFTCSFTASFTGGSGASQTNTITVVAHGRPFFDPRNPSPVPVFRGTASTTISITADVIPTITVTKAVTPPRRPEPGGSFIHTVTVTNTGSEPVRIVSLVDSVYGNLATLAGSTCTAAPGTVIPAAATLTCSFTARFAGEAGNSQTDVVQATVVDPDGTSATATGAATVALTDVPPEVEVHLSVTPQLRPEPGGTFTY
ncbi:MAG: hypothetical protein LC733_10025, partial [Actinobacteria bacterium]|nr:hypothetical protein [Actinomycetota bacterium]